MGENVYTAYSAYFLIFIMAALMLSDIGLSAALACTLPRPSGARQPSQQALLPEPRILTSFVYQMSRLDHII